MVVLGDSDRLYQTVSSTSKTAAMMDGSDKHYHRKAQKSASSQINSSLKSQRKSIEKNNVKYLEINSKQELLKSNDLPSSLEYETYSTKNLAKLDGSKRLLDRRKSPDQVDYFNKQRAASCVIQVNATSTSVSTPSKCKIFKNITNDDSYRSNRKPELRSRNGTSSWLSSTASNSLKVPNSSSKLNPRNGRMKRKRIHENQILDHLGLRVNQLSRQNISIQDESVQGLSSTNDDAQLKRGFSDLADSVIGLVIKDNVTQDSYKLDPESEQNDPSGAVYRKFLSLLVEVELKDPLQEARERFQHLHTLPSSGTGMILLALRFQDLATCRIGIYVISFSPITFTKVLSQNLNYLPAKRLIYLAQLILSLLSLIAIHSI